MSYFSEANFDATKVSPEVPFTPVPEGTYKVHVKAASEEPTRDGTGMMLKLEFSILEPAQFKGRTVFHRITLKNKNPTAVAIGKSQLAALCLATGIPRPKSAGQFCGKLMSAHVIVEKRQDNGEMANRVKHIVLPEGVAQAAATTSAPDTGAGTAAETRADAPWA